MQSAEFSQHSYSGFSQFILSTPPPPLSSTTFSSSPPFLLFSLFNSYGSPTLPLALLEALHPYSAYSSAVIPNSAMSVCLYLPPWFPHHSYITRISLLLRVMMQEGMKEVSKKERLRKGPSLFHGY